jgi:hypothetical protein
MSRKMLFLAGAIAENAGRFAWVLAGFLLVVGAVAWLVPGHTTNCGGNSAALARVQSYAALAAVSARYASDHQFHIFSPAEEQRTDLAILARSHWLPYAHFLVSTTPVQAGAARRVIVVCDTPFYNVPQRWIGSPPPAHAAGFSDGTAALISPAEFAALDRSQFVALDRLFPANSK